MEHVTISVESLEQLFSAACSFYLSQATIGTFSEEQKQQTIAAMKEAWRALGRDEESNVDIWLLMERAH